MDSSANQRSLCNNNDSDYRPCFGRVFIYVKEKGLQMREAIL